MKTIYFLLVFILLSTLLYSTIINVPADQPTIQQGIDVSVNADTVLVQPGTYFENINYNGKNITVASLFLTTQDTIYILQTIIDGNQTYGPSIVTFENGEDSTSVLSGFTITNGSASDGAGIYCTSSSPRLMNLIITNNSAGYGGGIYFDAFNSVIENVIISDNDGSSGGGIYSFISDLNFVDVFITENSAVWPMGEGGGIYFCGSNQSLTNVIISGNSATYDGFGGGIYCNGNDLSLEKVTISGNSAVDGYGGGICCGGGYDLILENVTISNNSADYGGGIFCGDIHIINIINSILWNDSNDEIIGSADVIYSNIQGGWAGTGNIDEDPLFVNPQIGDYHLTEYSPCIDAGDPNFPFDPDNTICDMGAFYFHQDRYIVVEEIYPEPGSLTISEGDSINFYITASDPDGNPIEYTWELDEVIISTDSCYIFYTDENSAGSYAVTLEVTDNYQSPFRNTLNFDWDVIVEDVSSADDFLHTVTAIYQNIPNPFNPSTTINYSLKENSKVSINIYNIKGQKVKHLVSDQLPVGQHSVIWNGKDDNGKSVSSGIYFYKLKTANFEKTKKMILMK